MFIGEILNLKVLDNCKYKEYLKEEVKLISPTAARLLQPKGPERVTKKLNRRKSKKAFYYNKGAKNLPELHESDRMNPLPTDTQKKFEKQS